jgi:alkaline phosphatase D
MPHARFLNSTLDRRLLLKAAVGAGLLTSPLIGTSPVRAQFKTDPFTLGIASGDPASDGFVIWTRLAPEPLQPRGGMPATPVEVTWQVASDAAMNNLLRSGSFIARIELAHAVHVEVEGLEPARDYFYRFRAGGVESTTGRARTLPVPGVDVAQLRFAAAGCQQWEGGHYTAWRAIADDHLDLVFHYGDYIYENAYTPLDRQGHPSPRGMPTDFELCYTLTDYRRRYALYKTDADLQAAHASCAFLPSFDDHEVANNWAATTDPDNTPPEAFLLRRAAAFQAWYEHMPVRHSVMPHGPDALAYRRFQIGTLADIAVLDTRQYRSKQPCGDGFKSGCVEADDAARTMMGAQEEMWLADALRADRATWQVMAQQVLFSHLNLRALPWATHGEGEAVDLDAWDGASAARKRVMAMWRDAKVANPVVLTGDLHHGVAVELKDDWRDPASPCVGVEFLATSISSGGDGNAKFELADALYADNPQLKFVSNQRGYHRHTVTPGQWQADFRVADQINKPGGVTSTTKSFVVEAGNPGLKQA